MSTGRHVCKLVGYAPALPTPFDENDAINAAAFERFCELQISNGATALVVGGTTGEAPNLSGEEHHELLRIATGVSRGRVPIISGAGSNSTRHAIELTKDAEASGADAILSVVPKQTQNANFTDAGFVSRKQSCGKLHDRVEKPLRPGDWPRRKVRNISRQRPGTTFEVTEMQPSPP